MKIWTIRLASALAAVLVAGAAHGEALDPPVEGPMLVCFRYSSFALEEGERLTGFTLGVHAGAVSVEGAHGSYRVGESDIFARPRRLGRAVFRQGETSVFRQGGRYTTYWMAGPVSYSDEGDQIMARLEGDALSGRESDRRIYRRVTVGDPAGLPCDRRFHYGWNLFFGED